MNQILVASIFISASFPFLADFFSVRVVLVLLLVVLVMMMVIVVDTEQLDVYGIVIDTLMFLLPCF